MKHTPSLSRSHPLRRFCVPPDSWISSPNPIGLDRVAAALGQQFGPRAVINNRPWKADAYLLTDALDEFDYAEILAEKIQQKHWPDLPVVTIGWRNAMPLEWPKATVYRSARHLWDVVRRQAVRQQHIETIHGRDVRELTEQLELAIRCRRICVFESLVPATFFQPAQLEIIDAIEKYLGHAKFEFRPSSQDADVFLLLDSPECWRGAERLFDVQGESEPDLPIVLLQPGPGGLAVGAFPNLEIALDVFADRGLLNQLTETGTEAKGIEP